MRFRHAWLALVSASLVFACSSPRKQPSSPQKEPTAVTAAAPPQVPVEATVAADYGVVPGRRTFDENNPEHYIREPGYPPGVFAVSITNRERLLAFDVDSNVAGICTRTDKEPFALDRGGNYVRFRCGDSWPGRESVFVDATQLLPTSAVELEWTALAGPSPLPMPSSKPGTELHDYAAAATPSLLDGKWLVSAAWFSGEYPPRKEKDELRGDTIAFGHYQLLDRILFIGESSKKPSTVLYQASDPIDVREGFDWAFLPKNASEKENATMSALYVIPNGYLLRVSVHRDHEGFGEDDSTYFYAWESGRWRLLAKAEFTRLY